MDWIFNYPHSAAVLFLFLVSSHSSIPAFSLVINANANPRPSLPLLEERIKKMQQGG
jgi:hypothetical protein